MNRMEDAKIAVENHGWCWVELYDRRILVPPKGDEKELWTGIWDKDGIPHFLPRYSDIE